MQLKCTFCNSFVTPRPMVGVEVYKLKEVADPREVGTDEAYAYRVNAVAVYWLECPECGTEIREWSPEYCAAVDHIEKALAAIMPQGAVLDGEWRTLLEHVGAVIAAATLAEQHPTPAVDVEETERHVRAACEALETLLARTRAWMEKKNKQKA